MIELKGVTKQDGTCTLLSGVSFQVKPKECIVITGPSGSGKSLILNLLLRAEDSSKGSVEVDGVNLRTLPFPLLSLYRQRLGVVFQERRLLNRRTVAENLAVPLEIRGLSDAAIEKATVHMLRTLRLSQWSAAFPSALSSAQQSLLALGRALIHHPLILLLDEPLTFLSEEQKELSFSLIKDAHHTGTTVVIFTGTPALFGTLAPRTISLREGKVTDRSPPPPSSSKPPPHHILEEIHATKEKKLPSPQFQKVKVTVQSSGE